VTKAEERPVETPQPRLAKNQRRRYLEINVRVFSRNVPNMKSNAYLHWYQIRFKLKSWIAIRTDPSLAGLSPVSKSSDESHLSLVLGAPKQ
jgi:hypothetical protein